MVEIIRNKWCEDLEDILLCPICMVIPKSWIYQCVQGHHICVDCKTKMSSCPTCTQRWSSSRNRLAESLCTKLDEIKLSLIDPESEINKLLIADRVSVSAQTDVATEGTTAAKKNDEHSGPYPCLIGRCRKNLCYAPLINHLKRDHPTQYIELPSGNGNVFQHVWFFDLVEFMEFDRAFHVPEKGTFFLKLSVDCFGNFTGFLLMLHNGFIAKQFTYQLEITCCAYHNTGKTYTGDICSCRTPVAVLHGKSLRIKRAEIQRMLDHKKNLTCTVLIGKKPQSNDSEAPPKPNNQGGKRFQNKKKGGGTAQSTVNLNNGPGPSARRRYMNNQAQHHRPQTARNGQQQAASTMQGHQYPQAIVRYSQGLHESQQELTDITRRFGRNRNPPSRTASVPSLLYPDLRDIL